MKGTQRRVKGLAAVLCIVMVLGMLPLTALAATEPAKTSNINDNAYTYDRWANPVKSYLVDNGDATYTRVEYTGEAVVAEIYDSELNFVSGRTIAMELPLFGGFYAGTDSYFLIFGKTNPNQDDNAEVIRVVRYSKSWERIGAASLCGANTTVPFDAGSLRCSEYNGYLYIRTAHEMYMSSDGRNHQSCMTMNVRIQDMVITDSFYSVMNSRYGYISHSFNQFISTVDGELVAVDHGDANPRSVVLTRYNAKAGQDSFMESELEPVGNGYYRYVYTKIVDVLPIMGVTGDNDTGVSLGGFEVSGSSYLIAGNTVAQDDTYDPDGQRNIFVSATSRENFTSAGTQIHYLTSYVEGDGVTLSNPQFVKIDANRFLVLWTESSAAGASLRYAFVDGTGELIGEIYTTAGCLSDCQPILSGNKVIWYVTSASAPAFFVIDLSAQGTVNHGHVYTYDFKSYPGNNHAGALSSKCMVCGAAGEDVVIPAFNGCDEYTVEQVTTAPGCTTTGYGYYYWNPLANYDVIQYSFGGTIPATGHSYGDTVEVPASCTQDGSVTGTCTVCGATETKTIPATGHSYVDGSCTACGAADPDYVAPVELFSLSGANVILGNDLTMNFALMGSNLNGTDYYAEIVKHNPDGTTTTTTYPFTSWTAYGPMYLITLDGLVAKQMSDKVEVTVYTAAGEQASYTWEDSIRDYSIRQLNMDSNSAKVKTCVADMLNYGAAAQLQFKYNTSDLANATMTDAHKAYATAKMDFANYHNNQKVGKNFYGTILALETNIKMGLFFKGTNYENYVAKVSYTHHNGSVVSYEVAGKDFDKTYAAAGMYGILIDSLVAGDVYQVVTVEVYDGDTLVASVSDSMESYEVRQSASLMDIYVALMKFMVSSFNYNH